MPSKIKSKLLIITVLCATLAVLFVIAPATAALYSVIFLGISLFLSILAWSDAKKLVEMQYKISNFMYLVLIVFVSLSAAIANILTGGMQYIMATICGLVVLRCFILLFAQEK